MNAKQFGTKVANNVGFDPTIIIGIITAIMTLIQNCKKPANRNAAGNMIDEEFAAVVSKKRKDKCPLQFRKVFRENGITSKEDMNDCWEAMVMQAKLDRTAVSALLA